MSWLHILDGAIAVNMIILALIRVIDFFVDKRRRDAAAQTDKKLTQILERMTNGEEKG